LRRDADDKVNERRPLYDNALVRALQMAISIGGMRGYKQFTSFNLESYQKGDLDFKIGKRPVFTKDALEDLETESMFWDVASKAKSNGMSIPLYLEKHGWEKDDINNFINAPEYQSRLKAMEMMSEGTIPSSNALKNNRAQNQLPNNKKKINGEKSA
jgi:hypothetical protein